MVTADRVLLSQQSQQLINIVRVDVGMHVGIIFDGRAKAFELRVGQSSAKTSFLPPLSAEFGNAPPATAIAGGDAIVTQRSGFYGSSESLVGQVMH